MSVTESRATGSTTNAFVTAVTLEAWPTDYRYIAVRVEETGSSNGIDFKVQGTLNNEDWLDLILLDETGSDHSAATVSVSAGSSDQAFVAGPASGRSGANACYGSYRVQVESTVDDTPGDYQVDVLAKE